MYHFDKKILLGGMLGIFLSMAQSGLSQGCVAIRAMSCSGQNGSSSLNQNSWLVGSNFRYFQSFRHFRGDEEEKERLEKNTEVINDAYTLDLNVGYGITERLSVSANLPLIHYDRSSLYEHYGNSVEANPEQKRFSTSATGIGDLRIGVNYSVTDPMKHSKFNLLVGAGVKFPTGKENVTDEFHKISSQGQDSISIRPVDQSIQLGDGGYGFNLEFQSQYAFSSRFSSYINGFYLVNPKNTNNTITRGVLPKTPGITDYHSIADQYAARAGVNYLFGSRFPIGAGLGGRVEGIPATDLIGDSEGFRRPGYIISAEPSLSYSHGPANFLVSVPYALYRNRIKSTDDKADPKGLKHGDAAFADYLINFSFSYRFGGKKHSDMESGMEH